MKELPSKERFMLNLAKAIHQMDLNRILTMKHAAGFNQEETTGEIADTIMRLGESLYESVCEYEGADRYSTSTGMFEVAINDINTNDPYVEVNFKPEEVIFNLKDGEIIW